MRKGKRNDGGGDRLREEDILIELLSRLDVKTLLQCKAVSKTWYSLISTPIFIKSHFNRALNGADNQTATTLIVRLFKIECLRDFPEEDGSFALYQLDCYDYVARLYFPYSKGDYPFTPPSLLIGCVFGIVCVCVDPDPDTDAYSFQATLKGRSDIYIWNPATKQSKLIPAHTLHDDEGKVSLGFGFDPIDFDFKVVKVLSNDVFPEVYSLNRNVWRKIEVKLSDRPNRNIFEICIHGFLFTVGCNGMMAFDLNREVFICDIKLPVASCDACIADFKDSIAVIIFNFKEERDRIKLWTLDDEACLRGAGVEASWTMMLSIDVGMHLDWVYGIFNSVEFLLESDDWFSYNTDKKEVIRMFPNPLFDFNEVFKYTESLVLVAGSKLVNWSADKDDNEESSPDSEEVSEEGSVDLEDNDEESSVGVASEDDNEESAADSEDNEESNVDSEDDAGDE
ncbi:F-box domain-containing protein [Heracleum sosnowskyi]|uniref:F-box domain-containing protein n=1 Tax=Heracleum sosnowskyi TaxID=360622 RepID=A0AAD8ILY5_9APIA|nr:F-box domain-containing protein [Heracleum sosnowskyi]